MIRVAVATETYGGTGSTRSNRATEITGKSLDLIRFGGQCWHDHTALVPCGFEGGRTAVSERRVQTLPIVETFDVLGDRDGRVAMGRPAPAISVLSMR
jgi:hypothetical protein